MKYVFNIAVPTWNYYIELDFEHWPEQKKKTLKKVLDASREPERHNFHVDGPPKPQRFNNF